MNKTNETSKPETITISLYPLHKSNIGKEIHLSASIIDKEVI